MGPRCHARCRRRATSLLPPPPAWCRSQHPALSTLGSASPLGTRTSGRLSPRRQHHPPSPATIEGGKPKKGSCGRPRGPAPAEDCAQAPWRPQTAPQPPGCPFPPARLHRHHEAHPSAISQMLQSHRRTRHGTRVPWPHTRSNTILEQNPTEAPAAPARASPAATAPSAPASLRPRGCTAAAVLPASLIFWEILHFKAVVLVWTSASAAPPVPSLPRLLVSIQGSVGYFIIIKKKKKKKKTKIIKKSKTEGSGNESSLCGNALVRGFPARRR